MKSVYFLPGLLSLAWLSVPAGAAEAPALNVRCFVYDHQKGLEKGPVLQKDIAMSSNGTAVVGRYRGRTYGLFYVDMGDGGSPRKEVSLSVRDAKTQRVLVSAAAVYMVGTPDIHLDQPKDALFYCSVLE